MGIDRRSELAGGESGGTEEEELAWSREVGIDRRSGVGGESGDRQEEWGERGREWGWTGGVG